MSIKNLINTNKQFLRDNASKKGIVPNNIITHHVRKMDFKPEKYRANDEYTNVTDLIYLCPRQYCMMLEGGIENYDRYTTSSDRITWAIGRAVEDHIRTQFIKATNYKNVYGVWDFGGLYEHTGCLTEEVWQHVAEIVGYRDVPDPTYKELRLIDTELEISGSPDMLVRLPNKKLMITEIKSIKKVSNGKYVGFEDLEEPLPDHVRQPSTYHRLATNKDNKLPVSNLASLVYVCKDWQRDGKNAKGEIVRAYKEFIVDVTNPLNQVLVDNLYEKAEVIATYRKTGKLPQNIYCASQKSKMAKDCNVTEACFSCT